MIFPCDVGECANEGMWSPVVQLRTGPNAVPLEARLGVAVCNAHCGVSVDVFLDDEGWEHLVAAAQAMGSTPLRECTTVEFVRLEGTNRELFEKLRGQKVVFPN